MKQPVQKNVLASIPAWIVDHFRRRPQSQLWLIKAVLWITGGALVGGLTLMEWEDVTLIVAGILGVDLTFIKTGERKTTVVEDPKLGAGQAIPPALYERAIAVAKYINKPIGVIMETLGAEGLELAVSAAETAAREALKRPLTADEAKDALREGAAAQ